MPSKVLVCKFVNVRTKCSTTFETFDMLFSCIPSALSVAHMQSGHLPEDSASGQLRMKHTSYLHVVTWSLIKLVNTVIQQA